jgi:ketosteroid isomerase-like protein
MKKWLGRLLLVAVLAGFGFWGWRTFFPPPEQVIRKRLNNLAQTASFSGTEGAIAKVAKAQALTAFCTEDVEVIMDVPGYPRHEIHGTAELLEAAAAARTFREGFTVQFFDIVVNVTPDQKSAVADLTAKGDVPHDRDFNVQELRFKLKKVDGKWLISHVETLHTLSR